MGVRMSAVLEVSKCRIDACAWAVSLSNVIGSGDTIDSPDIIRFGLRSTCVGLLNST